MGQHTLRNIVLIGTKLDLVQECQATREVKFEEAVEFAHKLGLAGVIETSSKCDEQSQTIDDLFFMTACLCQDHKSRNELARNWNVPRQSC